MNIIHRWWLLFLIGKPRPLSMPADTCIGVIDPYAKPWAQGRKGTYTHADIVKSFISSTITITINSLWRLFNILGLILYLPVIFPLCIYLLIFPSCVILYWHQHFHLYCKWILVLNRFGYPPWKNHIGKSLVRYTHKPALSVLFKAKTSCTDTWATRGSPPSRRKSPQCLRPTGLRGNATWSEWTTSGEAATTPTQTCTTAPPSPTRRTWRRPQ